MDKNIQTQINELKNAIEKQQNEINKCKVVTLDLKEENEKLKQEIKLLGIVKIGLISKIFGYDIKLN